MRPGAGVTLTGHTDAALLGGEDVATGDSVLLDRCESWMNLTARILRRFHPACRLVGLLLTGRKSFDEKLQNL